MSVSEQNGIHFFSFFVAMQYLSSMLHLIGAGMMSHFHHTAIGAKIFHNNGIATSVENLKKIYLLSD